MEVKIIGQMDNTIDHTFESANRVYDKNQLCPTIPTCAGGNIQPKIIEETKCVGGLSESKIEIKKVGQISNDGSQCGTVVSEDGLMPTLSAGCHGYANPHVCASEIKIKQATKEGEIACKVGGCFDASYPDSKTRRGRVQEGGDVVPTLTASSSENINYVETVYRIRKLTPRECWRLMGYTDADFDRAQEAGVSNSQLYKQAGNAIVKQVLMAIFKQMNIKCIKETA